MSMVRRELWSNRVESSWKDRSIVWLSGVRRVGKTTLAGQIDGIDYFNCDLPSVRRTLSDPEFFLESCSDSTIVLDEIHRIEDPSNLLKIAADEYPKIQIQDRQDITNRLRRISYRIGNSRTRMLLSSIVIAFPLLRAISIFGRT